MRFPIVFKTETAPEPPGQIYYEVAENGLFQVRETSLYRAVTRTQGPIPGLLPGREELVIRFPRLPRPAVEDVLAFFYEIYRLFWGEAVVIIFYCPERRQYRLVAPPQTVPGRWRHDGRWQADLSVRYDNVPRPHGFLRFGTMHSHADLPAFSSGLDCDDERYEDGLHVVFGDFGQPRISVEAAFVAGGVRFKLPPADVLEAWAIPTRPARRDWVARVKKEDRTLQASVPLPAPDGPPNSYLTVSAEQRAPCKAKASDYEGNGPDGTDVTT